MCAIENGKKSNTWWPDMWMEQLTFDIPAFLFNPQREFKF
jgi:hypothetical protein